MGQQNQKQQKSVEEKNGNHSIVKKMIVVKVRRLPLEMECEIFKFLKVPIQQKFIWGLGRRIYGMFGHKLLVKTKRLHNPKSNRWNRTKTKVTISAEGLQASNNTNGWCYVFAEQPFIISGENVRKDNFPGTILYYFEVAQMPSSNLGFYVGLSNGNLPDADATWIGKISNCYGFPCGCDHCYLSGNRHSFEWPNGAIQPEWNDNGDVVGCGLVLTPENTVSIFFTGNGILMGTPIKISSLVDRLFPTVNIYHDDSVEANFGDNSAKPFNYDMKMCPSLVFK